MNHEELTSELTKAFSKISEVLPRVEFDLVLYPIDEMKQKMEDLYAQLIRFYHRALKWYEASRAKHAVVAFLHPYKLRFEDILQEIHERARSIDKLAVTMARGEMRSIYRLVKQCLDEQTHLSAHHRLSHNAIVNIEESQVQTFARLADLQQLLVSHQAVNSGILLNTQQMVRENQVALMIAAASSSMLPTPQDSLRRLVALQSAQHAPIFAHVDCFWKDKALKAWAMSPEASLLIVDRVCWNKK
jgi:hypothetical protein